MTFRCTAVQGRHRRDWCGSLTIHSLAKSNSPSAWSSRARRDVFLFSAEATSGRAASAGCSGRGASGARSWLALKRVSCVVRTASAAGTGASAGLEGAAKASCAAAQRRNRAITGCCEPSTLVAGRSAGDRLSAEIECDRDRRRWRPMCAQPDDARGHAGGHGQNRRQLRVRASAMVRSTHSASEMTEVDRQTARAAVRRKRDTGLDRGIDQERRGECRRTCRRPRATQP